MLWVFVVLILIQTVDCRSSGPSSPCTLLNSDGSLTTYYSSKVLTVSMSSYGANSQTAATGTTFTLTSTSSTYTEGESLQITLNSDGVLGWGDLCNESIIKAATVGHPYIVLGPLMLCGNSTCLSWVAVGTLVPRPT